MKDDVQRATGAPSIPIWFSARLASAQPALYACACVLLAGTHEASDVVQNANEAMLEKASEVPSLEGFMPWAYTFIRFQVMSHHKRVSRQHHVCSSHLLDKIAACATSQSVDFHERLVSLEECLEELPARQQRYLALRYEEELSLSQIAAQMKGAENAVAAALYRARLALARCIHGKLAKGNEP
jgi:RNA polymerase sigma factor (sigma-70 family)